MDRVKGGHADGLTGSIAARAVVGGPSAGRRLGILAAVAALGTSTAVAQTEFMPPPAAYPTQHHDHHCELMDGWVYAYKDDPTEPQCERGGPFPPEYNGSYPTDQGFPSWHHPSLCFHWPTRLHSALGPDPILDGWDPWWGFPMNLDLQIGAAPPGLPPRSVDPVLSSSPLVASGPGDRRSLVTFAERPSLHGTLDLVSGAPMLQAIDLELPFGGAVFRHVRTYADSVGIGKHEDSGFHDVGLDGNFYGAGGYLWDWHGVGWMMSENPIFLFDAAPPGCTPIETVGESDYFRRRCYLVIDAHHSIPFDRVVIDGDPYYVAPAHFDAMMSFKDGDWDDAQTGSGTGEWEEYPTEFYVWLHGGAMKYTIAPVYEDLHSGDEIAKNHAHRQRVAGTAEGGDGLPYYGVVTRIEDRYGNYAALEYCDFRQWDCNKLDAQGDDPSDECPEDPALECCQSCHQKGQLRRVRLFAAGDEEPTWTLVYVHRDFWQTQHGFHDPSAPGGSIDYDEYPYFRQTALQSIYVFEGEYNPTEQCPTIHFDRFQWGYPETDPDQYIWMDGDPEMHREQLLLERLPLAWEVEDAELAAANWVHHIQYLYTDHTDLFTEGKNLEHVFPAAKLDDHGGSQWGGEPTPRLIRVAARHRIDPTDPETLQERHWTYRYGMHDDTGNLIYDKAFIEAVFEPESIEAIFAGMTATGSTGGYGSVAEVADYLLVEDSNAAIPIRIGTDHDPFPESAPLREAATMYFGRLHHYVLAGSGSSGELRLSGMRYIPATPATRNYGFWGYDYTSAIMASDFMEELVTKFISSEVGHLSFARDAPAAYWDRSAGRAYRMYRFFRYPTATTPPSGEICHADPHLLRSIWTPPHRLCKNYDDVATGPLLGAGDNLNQEVWFAVLDEFEALDATLIPDGKTQAHMPTLVDPDPGEDWGRPTARRVLAFNALGLKLWERYYQIEGTDIALIQADGYRERVEYDEYGRIRRRASRGWGAAEMQHISGDPLSPPITQGLVTRFEYDLPGPLGSGGGVAASGARYSGDPEKPARPVSTTPNRVFVQSGWGDMVNPEPYQRPSYYVKELLHDPSRPDLLRGEIDFVTPIQQVDEHDPHHAGSITYAGIDPEEAIGVFTLRTYWDTPDPANPDTGKVRTQITVRGGAAPIEPGGTALYAVEAEAYDEKGRLQFQGRGLVADPEEPGSTAGDIFFIDFFAYNYRGEPVLEVRDITQPAPSEPTLTYYLNLVDELSNPGWASPQDSEPFEVTLPAGWAVAHPQGVTAAEYETERLFGLHGPQRTDFPNERSEIIKYKQVVQDFDEYAFQGLVWTGSGWEFRNPGQVRRFFGGTMVRAERAYWTASLPVDPSPFTTYQAVYEVKVDYDPSGRPTGASVEGRWPIRVGFRGLRPVRADLAPAGGRWDPHAAGRVQARPADRYLPGHEGPARGVGNTERAA
jgi:hypothetical protein